MKEKRVTQCKCPGCTNKLTANKSKYCSNRCKQAVKYAVQTGRLCAACHQPNKPEQLPNGKFRKFCRREACTATRIEAVI